ncbi:MAG: hypothetical protein WBO24_07655, partial [Nitrospirales bacterium]
CTAAYRVIGEWLRKQWGRRMKTFRDKVGVFHQETNRNTTFDSLPLAGLTPASIIPTRGLPAVPFPFVFPSDTIDKTSATFPITKREPPHDQS